jgi:hypothetical protein
MFLDSAIMSVVMSGHNRCFRELRLLQSALELFYPRFQGRHVASLFASSKLVAGT